MENKPNRSMLVVYEDRASRDVAVSFCDELIRTFWSKCSFDVDWCSLEAIVENPSSRQAITRAVDADLIVFAINPGGPVPQQLKEWTEAWIRKRATREGAIVGLLDPSKNQCSGLNRYTWLRGAALRAGLNYLTQAPTELELIPESPVPYNERAVAVTSILDSILRHNGGVAQPRF
jgi:hypothetical protein